MERRRIDVRIPDDAFRRLRAWKEYRGLKWEGVLVEASEELPDGEVEFK